MEYIVQGSFETILLVDGLAINLITGEICDVNVDSGHSTHVCSTVLCACCGSSDNADNVLLSRD
ncbi:hypothetical protein Kuja_1040 [Vibrio phage vB_VchM_Kuja]|uniref:Uncharacterized protein n=1 Tax=Vibrio phage vB_VchM_Kuja TaxID=2686437 RepID=A0A6B9J5H9_9CAUD|nr:hypothetical protein HWC83_gp132 [Vibrio phage vB_VchM_Kuja]QGZ16095.1 hypothetical protein Kuja_1040 [Vibrio phage vB_VchM_Kuja]